MIAGLKNIGQSLTFLRLASVLAGASLWFYVLNSEPVRVVRDIPLRLVLPKGQVVANEWPQTVKVELKGARVFIETLQANGLEVSAELAAAPKRQTVRFSPSMIPVPFGVEVISIIPDTHVMQLVKESAKTLKVRPVFFGDPGPDMAFDVEKVEPATIKITGPWSLLKDVADLPTASINWADVDTTKNQLKIQLRELDPRLRLDGVSEVEVFYKLRPKKANLTLKNIPIRFLSSSRRINSRVREVALDVLVPEGNERALTKENVQVVADIPEGKKGQLKVDLRAVLPDGVHLLQIHPPSINISIK